MLVDTGTSDSIICSISSYDCFDYTLLERLSNAFSVGSRTPCEREIAHVSHAICLLQNLCFTKKIRYESRKQLAQARPRVKGQFVRVGDIADAVDALTEAGKVSY